jgi:hypothetical protein
MMCLKNYVALDSQSAVSALLRTLFAGRKSSVPMSRDAARHECSRHDLQANFSRLVFARQREQRFHQIVVSVGQGHVGGTGARAVAEDTVAER